MSSFEPFEQQASQWWNKTGAFELLHQMNPLRLQYINDHIKENLDIELENLTVLDVGCGGGILTIPLARLGMKVHGLDPGKKNIEVAIAKSKAAELDITYHTETIEKHKQQYDVVTAMEVIEHVDDYQVFLIHLCRVLKPGGLLFISTINRTIKSFAEAIVAAEYILRFVPRKTHEWNKFVKPSEIADITSACGVSVMDISGMKLNPFSKEWRVSDDAAVNYIMCLQKE